MNSRTELSLLQDAIKVYLDLTGPTIQLCHYLLKVLDFIPVVDNTVDNTVDNKSEMIDLSYRILINISIAMAERTNDNRLISINNWLNSRPTSLRIVPAQQFEDALILLTEIKRVKEQLNVVN